MSQTMGIVIYLVLWWLTFLVVVPISHRREIPWGLGKKILITTFGAGGLWLFVFAAMSFDLVTVKNG